MIKCSVVECERPKRKRIWCGKHYDRWLYTGSPTTPSRKDKREVKILEDRVLLQLGKDAKDGYAIVDLEFSYLDKFNWNLDSTGYPGAYIKNEGKRVRLHKVIMGIVKTGMVIDHINRNKLDNRKSNLRITTQSVNVRNALRNEICKRGHKIDDNPYFRPDTGARQCKACIKIRNDYHNGLRKKR